MWGIVNSTTDHQPDRSSVNTLRRIRRTVLLLNLLILLAACVVLLNFTAPNPTGRRYSSAAVVIDGTPNQIGASAEIVLSHDLGVEKNIVNFEGVIPDFITDFHIIESKNCASLPCEARGQFERLLALSHATGRELWIYTRVNTAPPADMRQLVRETGGDIISYFSVQGFADPVDRAALIALLVSGLPVGIISLIELRDIRRKRVKITMKRQQLVLLAGAALIIVLILLVLNVTAIRIALSSLETIMAIIFYALASLWLYRQIKR